jgi:Family of unknown function (DUF6502)
MHQMDNIVTMGLIPALFPTGFEQHPDRFAHNNYYRKCLFIVADSPNTAPNTSERVLETAARILAPLVRLLIAKGVTYQMASEVLKQVYVRVAQKQFVEDDEATGTRLSLLTGLNRKEIRRLTSEDFEKPREPMSSYASAVHSVWRTLRRWRDKDGNPKVLPRRSTNHLLSFDDLVKSVTTDHRPSAVFEELMRLEYIDVDAEDNVRLKPATFLYTPAMADRLLRLSENVEDHLSAAVINILEDEPKFLERYMYADNLSTTSADELQLSARRQWDKTQDILLEQAYALEPIDAANGLSNKTRIRVGMYFYSEESVDSAVPENEES